MDPLRREAEARTAVTTSKKSPTATRRFPYRKIEDIEAEIVHFEKSLDALHTELANPEVHRNRQRVLDVKRQLDETTTKLHELYEHWEEAHERN